MQWNQNEIIHSLKALGLTEYEAKVYLALLKRGRSTVREIAESSGVSRPKVYETLERLLSNYLAVLYSSNPASYVPLPLDEFLTNCRVHLDKRARFLKEATSNIADAPMPDAVVNIVDLDRILDQIMVAINGSNKSIHLHLCEKEAQRFQEALQDAHGRGVRLIGVVHGRKGELPGEIHLESEEKLDHEIENFGRPTILVFDGTEVLGGGLESINGSHAIHTRNPIVVRLALAFLQHDIMESEFERLTGKSFQMMLEGLRKQ